MMKHFKTLVLIGAMLLWAGAQPAMAQGFSSLIEKLDKLEARLAQLESSQKSDIQQIKKDLANTPGGGNSAQNQQAIAEMSAKIDSMNAELTNVKTGSDQIKQDYDQIMAELLELTYQLRETVKQAETQQTQPPQQTQIADKGTQATPIQSAPKDAQKASPEPAPMANAEPSIGYKFYGYLKLDGSYDQNLTNNGNYVVYIRSKTSDNDNDQLNMTANQSRAGVKFESKNYGAYKVNGQLEVDMYGSVTGATVAENKGTIMLRHAYFSIQKNKTKLLAGQSWDLFSPINPTTLNYTGLGGAGNAGYRRAQISLFQSFAVSKQSEATLSGGVFRNIGNDLTPTLDWSLADSNETADGVDDGTDSAIPSIQGKFDMNHSFVSGAKLNYGISGLWGQYKAETNLGHYNTYESWGVCGHLMMTFKSGFGFGGEYYQGSNLGSYFGGILNNSTVDGVGMQGGWGSLWFMLSPKAKVTTGAGMDEAAEEDITTGTRQTNQSIFCNVTYEIVKNVSVGLEGSQWKTEYKGGDEAKSFRAQTSFMMTF